jgi:pimeloyl-ACP methyl ester carboxylesterase
MLMAAAQYPAVSRSGSIDVPGASLAWSADGEGDAVLLVHAGIADQRMWEPLLARLTPSRLVVRYDMRGFGASVSQAGAFSPASDLVALLDALELAEATVVGASLGGLVALSAGALAPERVRRLVLLGSLFTGVVEPSPEMEAYGNAEEQAFEAGDLDAAIELNLGMWLDRTNHDPQVRALVADMTRRSLELQLAAEPEPEFPDLDLSTIEIPTTVVIGTGDVSDFQAMAVLLARGLPDATRHEIDGAGHLLALERPDEIAELILT